jgi:hypothetical protein
MARITPFKISKEAVAEEKKVAKRKRETSAKKGELRAAPTEETMLCIAMILRHRWDPGCCLIAGGGGDVGGGNHSERVGEGRRTERER